MYLSANTTDVYISICPQGAFGYHAPPFDHACMNICARHGAPHRARTLDTCAQPEHTYALMRVHAPHLSEVDLREKCDLVAVYVRYGHAEFRQEPLQRKNDFLSSSMCMYVCMYVSAHVFLASSQQHVAHTCISICTHTHTYIHDETDRTADIRGRIIRVHDQRIESNFMYVCFKCT